MIRRTVLIGLGATVLAAGGVPLLPSARGETASPAPGSIPDDEQRQTIAALKPVRRQRPAIAIVALNQQTEITDLLSTYGVLAESGVADVTTVAERSDPIRLYTVGLPGLSVDPQQTFAQFDAAHPDGADYVVVPAMDPDNDPAVIAWIQAQQRKGATIVSVCNGSATLAAAGLLDGRRATGHWYYLPQIRKAHPTMQWVRDRRYVADRGVATSTGITASIPLMMALVEAIAGRATAQSVAQRLGVDDWGARHTSNAFQLGVAHRTTFVRNKVSVWRHETIGIVMEQGVDEIALGLMIDAYARTELATVAAIALGTRGGPVQSRRGLRLRADPPPASGTLTMLQPQSDAPARTIIRELTRIASRYDAATAALVALTMEYPLDGAPARLAQSGH